MTIEYNDSKPSDDENGDVSMVNVPGSIQALGTTTDDGVVSPTTRNPQQKQQQQQQLVVVEEEATTAVQEADENKMFCRVFGICAGMEIILSMMLYSLSAKWILYPIILALPVLYGLCLCRTYDPKKTRRGRGEWGWGGDGGGGGGGWDDGCGNIVGGCDGGGGGGGE